MRMSANLHSLQRINKAKAIRALTAIADIQYLLQQEGMSGCAMMPYLMPALKLSKNGVNNRLDSLRKLGWIARPRIGPTQNRRNGRVYITPEGHAALRAAGIERIDVLAR